MMWRIQFFRIILCVVAGVSLSCRPGGMTILSDRPELAAAVEYFSSERPDILVNFRYAAMLDSGIIEQSGADLVIGSGLSADSVMVLMRKLPIDTTRFYSSLSEPVERKGKPYLIPLSFQLPLLIVHETANLPASPLITPEDIRRAAGEHGRKSDGRWTHLGFSPSWDGRIFLDLLSIRRPSVLAGGPENVDPDILDALLEEVTQWIREDVGSLDEDRSFSERYRYLPDAVLVQEGRILLARSDFQTWIRLPESMTQDLDFRYLSGPRMVRAIDVVFAGIPRKSRERKAAEDFIHWLTRTETQDELMTRWEWKGLTVFGFLGGLSSLAEVNESVLIRHFPFMEGRVLEGHYLASPIPVPDRWIRIRDEVLLPWFKGALYDPQNIGFAEYYHDWDLSSLNEGS